MNTSTYNFAVIEGERFLKPDEVMERMLNRQPTNGVLQFQGYDSKPSDMFKGRTIRRHVVGSPEVAFTDVTVHSHATRHEGPITVMTEIYSIVKIREMLENILNAHLINVRELKDN